MVDKKSRESNFELMRIVSMFFIALFHFFVHGGILHNSTGIVRTISYIIVALTLVHVNSFVLLTGFFNYKKEFKLSKIIKINNSIWLYRSLFLIFFIVMSYKFSRVEILHRISPIPRCIDYWFLVIYMLLLLISPLLNIIIKNINQKKHRNTIIMLFALSFIAYITNGEFYRFNDGFTLFLFIFLYFLGAYLNKYSIVNNALKKNKKSKIAVISLLIYIIFALLNFLLFLCGKYMIQSNHALIQYYGRIFSGQFDCYLNPLVIFSTVSYFVFFSQLNIKSRIINFYGKYILGVYLITDDTLFRGWIYKKLGFSLKNMFFKHIILAVMFSLTFIIILPLIEFLRTKLFEFFYNRKLAKKNRENIQKFIYKTGLDVKW